MGNNRQNWYLKVNETRYIVTCDIETGWRFHFRIWLDGQEIYYKKGHTGKAVCGTYPINLPTGKNLIELQVSPKMGFGIGSATLKYILFVDGKEIQQETESIIEMSESVASAPTLQNSGNPITSRSNKTDSSSGSVVERIKEAKELLDQGLIDEDEFKVLKSKIIAES